MLGASNFEVCESYFKWQYFPRHGSTSISTVLGKLVRFFITNIFLIIKNTFQVEIWPISCLNDSENPGKVDFKELKSKTFSGGSLLPDPPRSLCLRHSFRKLVSIYPRSAPVSCGGVLYWYSSTGILLLKTGQSYHLPFLFLFKENSIKTKDLLTGRTGQPFSLAILVIMLSDP